MAIGQDSEPVDRSPEVLAIENLEAAVSRGRALDWTDLPFVRQHVITLIEQPHPNVMMAFRMAIVGCRLANDHEWLTPPVLKVLGLRLLQRGFLRHQRLPLKRGREHAASRKILFEIMEGLDRDHPIVTDSQRQTLGRLGFRTPKLASGALRLLLATRGEAERLQGFGPERCVAAQLVARSIAGALVSPDDEVRAEAAALAREFPHEELVPDLAACLSKERDARVLGRLIKALMRQPARWSVPPLIKALPRLEQSGTLATAAEALRALTGRQFGAHVDRWIDWWRNEDHSQWR